MTGQKPCRNGCWPSAPVRSPLFERFLLCRAEVEAVGADLAGHAGLGDRLGERRGEHVVAGERADHVAARLEERHDGVDRIVRVGVDADAFRTGIDLEGVELAGGLQRRDGRARRRR